MRPIRTIWLLILAGLLVATVPATAQKRDRATRDFEHIDGDGDGKISRAEWLRRGNFMRLDTDRDGFLSRAEMRVHYRGALLKRGAGGPAEETGDGGKKRKGRKGRRGKRKDGGGQSSGPRPSAAAEMDPGAAAARAGSDALDGETMCAIARTRNCDMGPAIKRGLLATGLGPEFPDGADCHGIDDYFAMDYSFKRNRTSYHGGIDLPADWGTPMIAAAAGTVVAKFKGDFSARGIEIVLRHSPEDTGLALWTYSQYAHFDAMPKHAVGQRVKMGEVLGPTGNSGISPKTGHQSKRRRPAIHFAVWFSKSDKYAVHDDVIIPVDGYWMDPIALYRRKPPFESASLKALPDAEKGVAVPVMYEDGTVFPAGTKLVWPYKCGRD